MVSVEHTPLFFRPSIHEMKEGKMDVSYYLHVRYLLQSLCDHRRLCEEVCGNVFHTARTAAEVREEVVWRRAA